MSGIDPGAHRDPVLARRLIDAIGRLAEDRTITLMEVCGTHTMNIGRYGFRSVMPPGVRLLSGPGCPVCVTPNHDLDNAIALARVDGVTLATFGDLMRVPGSSTTLARCKADGCDVRVVYSPLDALALARSLPHRQVAFAAMGFETTAPAVAATILRARERGLENFSVLCSHKTTPPALRAIARDPDTRIDGFILPGHVAAITGIDPFGFLPREFHTPGVVTGFEPVDILEGIATLIRMVAAEAPAIENAYRRVVAPRGNPVARQLVDQVFEPVDAVWRGLGTVSASGLRIRSAYADLDAQQRFDIEAEPARTAPGCRCGDVLRGAIPPGSCPLFGRSCTPEHPIGPCMVSSEGSCAAAHRFREP